jgi:alanine dehydrogenase
MTAALARGVGEPYSPAIPQPEPPVTLPFLDEARVRSLLRLEDLIPAMRSALEALSGGRVVQPVRTVVPVAEHSGFFGVMPAYAGAGLGAKLVTFYPGNSGVPTHHAIIVLFRPETGEPVAVMDGRLITELRTAAASAVATDLLARPDASVLGMLGAGVQAGSHLDALSLVRQFREVRVWSPRSAAAFAAARPGVAAAASAEAAVQGADVIVTATSSMTPVLVGDWVAPGAHVNAVGACRPEWRELDDALLARRHRRRRAARGRDRRRRRRHGPRPPGRRRGHRVQVARRRGGGRGGRRAGVAPASGGRRPAGRGGLTPPQSPGVSG